MDKILRAPLFGTGLLAASILGAGLALADADSVAADSGDYFYGFDEASLRRDIAGVAYRGDGQADEVEGSDNGSGMVFLGGGYIGFWYPASGDPDFPNEGGLNSTSRWTDRIQIGVDWRPDLGVSASSSPRATVRYLTGGEPDRVGVRADLTALLYDRLDPSRATAWRITGMFGSTSVSLTPDPNKVLDAENDTGGGLMWDIGIGWSSGAISLNAGYLAAYRETNGLTADIAVLSFGADYAILPGLSLYGEVNLVDDREIYGEERLGTVLIVGTGLNF